MTDGERIHILRTYYGYSMRMLADLLGVSKQYIGAFELGTVPISLKVKRATIKVFELPTDFFVSYVEIKVIPHRGNVSNMDDPTRITALLKYYDMSYIRFSEYIGVSRGSLDYVINQHHQASKRLKKIIIEKCNLPDDFFSCDIELKLKITPPKY